MNLLEGKTILITGGSVGIGSVVANRCAKNGARVIVVSRTESDLKKAVDGLNKISDKQHMYKVVNVSDNRGVEKMAGDIRSELGGIDGLVNCAGIYGPIGRIDEIDMDKFVEAININFLGTVYMCHSFVPLMKNRGAKIVNYSGGGAATPFPNYSAYATSKVATVRLTENLAKELSDYGIEVNAVAPGFVVTRLHQDTFKAGKMAGDAFLESTRQQVEKGGVSPDLAADLTVFLLSQRSNGLNGKFISAPWDNWRDFGDKIGEIARSSLYTLRRIDDKTFREVK